MSGVDCAGEPIVGERGHFVKESDIRPQALFNRYLELARGDVARFFAGHVALVDVACPACGDTGHRPGLEKLGFRYVVCAACGTLYLSPRPTSDRLDTYYREAEAVRFWSTHFYKETLQARRERMFRPRAELVGELAARYEIESGETFVDIGAGYGVMLEEVQKLGCFATIIGIEPNPDLAEVCRGRGFVVIEKPVERVASGECSAGFATSFEVLEHVFDPLAFLVAARRTLRPGGLLLFTTLTASGFDIQILWEASKSVYPPLHINLISVEGMRRLVARAGYNVAELTTPGQLDVDIVANAAAEDPAIRLPRFIASLLASGDEAVREDFQAFLQRNLLSSHIRVVARA